MDGPDPACEWVELQGGILDGLIIRFGLGRQPLETLEVDRGGVRWTYRRTARRTARGATVFRLDGRAASEGAGP